MNGYHEGEGAAGQMAAVRERLAVLETKSVQSMEDRADMRHRMERLEMWNDYLHSLLTQRRRPEILHLISKIEPMKLLAWVATAILMIGSTLGWIKADILEKIAGLGH